MNLLNCSISCNFWVSNQLNCYKIKSANEKRLSIFVRKLTKMIHGTIVDY